MSEKIRAVIIGTGTICSISARCLQGRDDIELVGCWAHKETAGHVIGTDPGLLDGNIPWNITITGEEEDIWALKPDVAIIAINVMGAAADNIIGNWFVKCLERGINVVATSIPGLIFPQTYPNQDLVKRIDEACKKGNSTFYTSGEEPGFAEQLVALILTGSNTIKTVTTSEIADYSPVTSREQMEYAFGFGMAEDYKSLMETPGIQSASWGAPINYVAHYLGCKIERMEETYEKRITDKDIEVGYGTIKAGTVGAVRFKTIGIVEDRPAIVVEHVSRMSKDLAPDWPTAEKNAIIRITLEGDPNLSCDFVMGDSEHPENQGYEGYVLTAMRIINAIPFVVESKPGLLTSLDMPLYAPTKAFRSDETLVDHKVCR